MIFTGIGLHGKDRIVARFIILVDIDIAAGSFLLDIVAVEIRGDIGSISILVHKLRLLIGGPITSDYRVHLVGKENFVGGITGHDVLSITLLGHVPDECLLVGLIVDVIGTDLRFIAHVEMVGSKIRLHMAIDVDRIRIDAVAVHRLLDVFQRICIVNCYSFSRHAL